MLPSRNPDFPDALVRRLKDPNKVRSARKSAAAAAAAAAREEEGDAEPDEAGGVGSAKKVKAKPMARKSDVPVDGEAMNGVEKGAVEVNGLQGTLADQAAKVRYLFLSSVGLMLVY